MPGVKALRKIQLGAESTPGTAVAASTIWRGFGALEDKRKVEFIGEDVGYLSGIDRSAITQLLGELEMGQTPGTFEQLPYILAAGIKNVTTGSADGAGSGKIYIYTAPTTSPNTIKTYTIQGGDNQEAERMEYAFVESLKLSGKPDSPLTMSAKWKGRTVTVNAFTGGLSLPTVEEILFGKGKLYIDAENGTIGTTLQSTTLVGMDIDIKTGWVPIFTADGQLYFSTIAQIGPEIKVELTFLHDSVGSGQKTNWRNETAKLFRLLFEGSSLATPGTAYSKKTLKIDFAAKVEAVSKLDEQDGLDVLKVTLKPRYNSYGKFFEIVVVNELASLP